MRVVGDPHTFGTLVHTSTCRIRFCPPRVCHSTDICHHRDRSSLLLPRVSRERDKVTSNVSFSYCLRTLRIALSTANGEPYVGSRSRLGRCLPPPTCGAAPFRRGSGQVGHIAVFEPRNSSDDICNYRQTRSDRLDLRDQQQNEEKCERMKQSRDDKHQRVTVRISEH